MSEAIDMIRDAVAFADATAKHAGGRNSFRLWNRMEGVQIDLGVLHQIVPWSEIEHAKINVIKVRMEMMLARANS